MDDALFMRGGKRARDVPCPLQCKIERQPSLDEAGSERGAVQEFGHDVQDIVVLTDFIHRDDVGMVQSRGGERFLPQQRHPLLIVGDTRAHHFDRDIALESKITRLVDLAHAAGGEVADNPEPPADDMVRSEHQAGWRGTQTHLAQPHQRSLEKGWRGLVAGQQTLDSTTKILVAVAGLRHERQSLTRLAFQRLLEDHLHPRPMFRSDVAQRASRVSRTAGAAWGTAPKVNQGPAGSPSINVTPPNR
jgi:hypothetical protein